MSTNALPKQPATTSQSDSQEMPLTVVDARDATSHLKFQTIKEQLVSKDHLLIVIALREELTEDMLVSNAQ
jgi:hypothetical protein